MGYDTSDDWDAEEFRGARLEPIRRLSRPPRRAANAGGASRSELRAARRPETESFRCRHCRAMVGPTIDGGRHRNHCPYCLRSRHVDDRRPGDRASRCRALMAPVALLTRRTGEQVLVHRCLGCGIERHNRVAADDDPIGLMRLRLLDRQPAEAAAAMIRR